MIYENDRCINCRRHSDLNDEGWCEDCADADGQWEIKEFYPRGRIVCERQDIVSGRLPASAEPLSTFTPSPEEGE